jgi:hypothetical protein
MSIDAQKEYRGKWIDNYTLHSFSASAGRCMNIGLTTEIFNQLTCKLRVIDIRSLAWQGGI